LKYGKRNSSKKINIVNLRGSKMIDKITIKQAQESDIPVIEDIMLDVVDFLDSIGQPMWRRERVTWQGLSEDFCVSDFYIAYINDNPAGCMALIDYDPEFWADIEKGESLFIHKLAVKRCKAKQGVSKALISFAKTQAIKQNINEVRLDTHQFREKVRAVYEREGFVCVEEKCLFESYHTAFYVWKASFAIRKAAPADAEALHELYFDHLAAKPPKEPQDMAAWQKKLARLESDPHYHILVGEADGRVVSSVTLVIIENLTNNLRPYAIIENVVTHADCRGRNYASTLMDKASDIAARHGCYKIMLMTGSKKESTLGFYEKCGFDKNEKTAFIKRF
jgi:GNAT superfamily N-acetyltransferase